MYPYYVLICEVINLAANIGGNWERGEGIKDLWYRLFLWEY